MANRWFNQFLTTPAKGIVIVKAQIAFAATAAPTLVAWNPSTRTYAAAPTGGTHGVTSVARNGTGDYTIVLQDTYQRLAGFFVSFIGSANAVAPLFQVKVASNPNLTASLVAQGLGTTAKTINLLLFSAANTAADPAATELGIVTLHLQNSAAF